MSPSFVVRFAPLLFVALWSTGFIGARAGMPHAEPGTFLSVRFALACLLMATIAGLAGAQWPRKNALLGALVVGALVHGVYLGGVFWAIDRGMPAGVAAFVVGLQPLLTALIARVWLDEPISQRHQIGIGLGLVGVALVLAPGLVTGSTQTSGITAPNLAAAGVAAIAVTVGTVLQKRLGAGTDLRSGTAVQYLGALIPVLLLSSTEARVMTWNGELLFALAWLVVVLSLGAVFLLMWLIREGSVSQVASLFYLVPSVTSLIAWALFGETLSALQLLGMALTAAAVWLATSSTLSTRG